jgi:Flp pilus assembly protein TadG
MVSSVYIKKNNHRPKWERGQAFVLVALGMVALIGVIGLATDAAMIYKTKQDLQRAVDSAALAGAYKLPNQTTATQAVYEFMRLHGYELPPTILDISFPNNDVKKIVHVEGTTNANYFFLRVLGFNTMTVSAMGEGEAAPMDIYLILDLSQSMVYDLVQKPSPWPSTWPAGFPKCNSGDWDPYPDNADCVAKYCNAFRKCDPLDTDIKPAAYFFIDQLDPRYDRVGVVSYDQSGVKVIGLTADFNGPNGVKAKIGALNAFNHQGDPGSNCPGTSPASCKKQTNIGDGIKWAHDNIASEGRIDAIWSMILLTDGRANVYRSCSGCPPSCGTCSTLYVCEQCTEAGTWAINNAKDTWKRHEATIYTIAFGDEFITNRSYKALMIEIADWTDNGLHDNSTTEFIGNFWSAPDGPTLQNAFLEIASRIYARLLK